MFHNDRSRTPRLCLMTLKVTMTIRPTVAYSEANLTYLHTIRGRRGWAMQCGVWCTCSKGETSLPRLQIIKKKGAQRAHPVFRSFLSVDWCNRKACLWCRAKRRKAGGGIYRGLELSKVGVAVAITGLPSARLEDGAHARGDVRTESASARSGRVKRTLHVGASERI